MTQYFVLVLAAGRRTGRSGLMACLGLLVFNGCGEPPVEGKPAVGYGAAAPDKISPVNNQLPAPQPLEIPGTENSQ